MSALSDPFTRGLEYLYWVRSLAVDPDLISVMQDLDQRTIVCEWVGQHIESINAELSDCLQSCHDCFHYWQQRSIQVLAAPFAAAFELDGICNLHTQPITILVDVGRVAAEDWLALVAHEYAHAHLGSPGHGADFSRILTHLCRGLGLDLSALPQTETEWRCFPPYRRTASALDFWGGRQAFTILNNRYC
jgi:hypothetical protein